MYNDEFPSAGSMDVTPKRYDRKPHALTLIDTVIDSKYQILEELGSGSFGYLFLGQSLRDNSFVAIKAQSKPGLDRSQLELQQLEVNIQKSLMHPHLLALHETHEDENHVFMVMELCDQDLFDYLMHSRLHESQVASVFLQVLDAVGYMHAHNVYHRDLKLENILLTSSEQDGGFRLHVKVGDFGLATRARFHQETGCGSTAYLGPEHFDTLYATAGTTAAPVIDAAASDVWSLGIVLLTMLFGRHPWQEANPQTDCTFRAFQHDPRILKQEMFPCLSMPAYRFLISVLMRHPSDRQTDIGSLKQQFTAIDHLLVSSDDDENETWPVIIPSAGSIRKTHVLMDSAVFSCNTDESWSDLVEQDDGALLAGQRLSCKSKSTQPSKDDQDIFVHDQEMWWL